MDEQKKFAELYQINIGEYENIDIDSLPFSVRVNNRLHQRGIETVGALLDCTHEKLVGIKGFGASCFKEIYDYLELLCDVKESRRTECKVETKETSASFLLKENSVIRGEFAFENEEEDVAAQYKEAQMILESTLVEECILNPIYIAMIRSALQDYMDVYIKASRILDKIPCKRKSKMAKHYINACSSYSSGKKELLDILCYDNVTLETYFKRNINEFKYEQSPITRFAKACSFDIYEMISKFFEEVQKDERAYSIVTLRAKGHTLEQIGNTYSVTRERVRQIEKKIGQKFINWIRHNNILYKIVAESDGDNVLLPSDLCAYFENNTDVALFLLKAYENELEAVNYNKGMNLFVIGEKEVFYKVQDFVDNLPEQFNVNRISEIIENGAVQNCLSEKLIYRAIENDFNRTGDMYHRSRLTLGKIYSDVLQKYYPTGIWVYNEEELEEFRNHVLDDYGDIKLPENNRALVGRITSVGLLCGRGIYGPKKERYLSEELMNKIHNYINESEAPIFLTNTLFSIFEDELINEGINNKYHLQGIMRELFEDEYVFRRDYISKDKNITTVYAEIVAFIERAPYPVTKRQINDAFPGVTEIIINFSVNDPEIINLFGVYIHANKLVLDRNDLNYIDKVMAFMFEKNKFMHCKDIYEYVRADNANILTSNGIYQAFGFYSVLEYLYRDEYEFSRPYIGKKGVEITRTFDQLHEMIQASDIIDLTDIATLARENHFQINSILEFVNTCNGTHLLINDKEVAAIEFIGMTEENAREVETYILEELSGTEYITNLQCVHKFPKLNVPWTEWLTYSVINKWSSMLEVAVTSTTFRQAKPLVSLKGMFNLTKIGEVVNSDSMYMPDNIDDIDELITDILLDEIEG